MLGLSWASGTTPAEEVFLIAGQSNAGDGNGLVAADLNAHSVASDAGIQVWNGTAFETLVNGTNNDILQDAASHTWGPEVEFVYQWRLANPAKTLYLIPYRVGGTYLANVVANCWAPPSVSVSGTRYFNNMTAYRNAALATLKNPKVRAILWMQGENDATNLTAANAYETNLGTLVTEMRTYWGNSSTKVIIGRILNLNPAWTYADTVRAAQAAVVSANPSFMKLVDTDAFANNQTHYSNVGQVSLGGAMYTQYASF